MTEPHLRIVDPSYSVISFPSKELPPQYKALIFSKWLRSLRFGNPLFEKIDSNEYYKHYHAFIENLLAKPDAIVRLAVLTEDHDVVLGWACSREDVLDYIHVHRDQRRQGICKKLIQDNITTITHLTKTVTNIVTHNPKYKLINKDNNGDKDPSVRYFVFNPFA